MKNYRIILSIFAFLYVTMLNAQVPVEVMEELHPVIYPFTINIKTANAQFNDVDKHDPLTEEYGFVIIPSSAYKQKEGQDGSLGILVAHLPGDRYTACELRCARCLYEYKQHNLMTPMKSISPGKVLGFFECKHCGVQLDGAVYTGNTCLSHHEFQGTQILNQEGYVVEPIKNEYGYIKELRITNSVPMIRYIENAETRQKLKQMQQRAHENEYSYPQKKPMSSAEIYPFLLKVLTH